MAAGFNKKVELTVNKGYYKTLYDEFTRLDTEILKKRTNNS